MYKLLHDTCESDNINYIEFRNNDNDVVLFRNKKDAEAVGELLLAIYSPSTSYTDKFYKVVEEE